MMLLVLFFVAFLAFMGGYEAGWYVARDPDKETT